jgi:Predicted soluble lytic transglycosylase fused to an ABC-type amino acid-binding protein
MNLESLTKFWPLIYSIIQEFWSITEPHIEDAAIRNDIPIELYLYSELGLDTFSLANFEKRDPFTNPEQFEKVLVRLNVKGWIEPMSDGSFRVTENAREAVRHVLQAGDAQLLDFHSISTSDLERLAILLKQIVAESKVTDEPPEKWAILKRFHVAGEQDPVMVRIREYLMDLFAYRDDSHLSASRPHFNQAGIVWMLLSALWNKDAVTAKQMAEKMTFRGYEISDYEVALQAAVEVGWAEAEDRLGAFRLSKPGIELREQAEHLTNEYFYTPWSVLVQAEIVELYNLLTNLHTELNVYRKSR